MAEEKETILIGVEVDTGKVDAKLDEVTAKVLELENAQKGLKQAFKDGTISASDYSKQTKAVSDALGTAKRQQSDLIKLVQAGKTSNDDYGDSLDEERRKLNDMQKAYAALDKDMRESKGGEEFRKRIKEQSDAVKAAESAIGDNRRNVGNYAEALKQAGVSIGGTLEGVKSKATALLANPWAAVVGAVVAVVKKLVDAFKSSEGRMREIQSALSPLRAGLDIIKQLFDAMAKSLSGVVTKALKDVASGFEWLARQIDKFGKLIGKDWGLEDRLQEMSAVTDKMTKKEQQYTDDLRKFKVMQAQYESDISDLRLQAADKANHTDDERIALLEKAAQKEEAIYKEKKRLASEQLAILQLQASESENDAEMNDRLADAEAAVILADKELADKQRELVAQINEAKNAIKTKAAAEIKAAEDAAKAEKKAEEDRAKAVEEEEKKKNEIKIALRQELEDQMNELIDNETDREIAQENTAFNRRIEAIQSKYSELAEADSEARQIMNSLIEQEQKEHERKLQEINDKATENYRMSLEERKQIAMQNAAAISGAIGGLGDILEQFSEENKGAAIASKAIALGQIAVQTGIAIAGGIAQAQSVPFPANIAAIATTIGTVLANIATAISTVKSANFDSGNYANGGVVGGASYTGDKLIAHVNSGEGIYTTKQANNILQQIANSPASDIGLNYELLGKTMAAAVSAQPAPVMAYAEFEQFQKRTSTYKEFAKI